MTWNPEFLTKIERAGPPKEVPQDTFGYWWKGQGAFNKTMVALDLGGPYAAAVWRIVNDPETWRGAPSSIRFSTVRREGELSGSILDPFKWVKGRTGRNDPTTDAKSLTPGRDAIAALRSDPQAAMRWVWPRVRARLKANPKLGEQLAEKESFLKRLFTDLGTSPTTYLGATAPSSVLLKYGGKAISTGGKIIGSSAHPIGKTALTGARAVPGLRTIVSPKNVQSAQVAISRFWSRPLSRIPDAELEKFWYEMHGQAMPPDTVKMKMAAKIREALGKFTPQERAEGASLAEYRLPATADGRPGAALNEAQILQEIKAGRIPKPSRDGWSAFKAIRSLTQEAYLLKPENEVKALGVQPRAWFAKTAEEREAVRRSAGIKRIEDPADGSVLQHELPGGKVITPYREGYVPRANNATSGNPVTQHITSVSSDLPRHDLPEHLRKAAHPDDLEEALLGMFMREHTRAGNIQDTRLLARVMARSEELRQAGWSDLAVKNALDTFRELEKQSPKGLRLALQIANERLGAKIDRLPAGVKQVTKAGIGLAKAPVTPIQTGKKLVTIYNPAWYVSNFIDSALVKNSIAGVPPQKLLADFGKISNDLHGKPLPFSHVTWSREMGSWQQGVESSGSLQKFANWIEGGARNKLGSETYWKEANRLLDSGASRDAAHEQALTLARKVVREVHFDYDNLSGFDKAMRKLIPFWVYETNQLGWIARTAAKNPRAAWAIIKSRQQDPKIKLPVAPQTLTIEPSDVFSFNRVLTTLAGESIRIRSESKTGRTLSTTQNLGIRLAPLFEQGGYLATRKPGAPDLMDDHTWKSVAPLLTQIGKAFGKDPTYQGFITLAQPAEGQRRGEDFDYAFQQRILERVAYSILDGKQCTLPQAQRYVLREYRWAGAMSMLGIYPKIREPKFQEMQQLKARYFALSKRDRSQFLEQNPALQMWFLSRER